MHSAVGGTKLAPGSSGWPVWIDVMDKYRSLYNTRTGTLGMAYERIFGVKMENAHSAVPDAQGVAHIWLYWLAKGLIQSD